MEFDLEIIPTKLIKGQGLARLLAESNCKVLDVNLISNIHGQILVSDIQRQSLDSNIQPYLDYL